MTFPATYDDDNTLYGDLADQKSLVLRAGCTSLDTHLLVESTAGVTAPTFLRFGNEIAKVTTINPASIDVIRDPAAAASHTVGDALYMVVTAEHLNVLRDRAIETQKYQGLVGVDADKPSSPEVSEVYIATDTEKVYVCLVAGQWSLLGGAKSHADVQRDGETDDHPQYYTQSRLTAWHGSLGGEHVTDGDDHDHRYGEGACRVRTASAATLPNKGVGYVRLATDTSELFIGTGASTWVAITGAPSGAIMMLQESDLPLYNNNCPPGWTRYTELDGNFPRGATAGVTSPLLSGGATSHTHTYSQVPAHTHSIAQIDITTSSNGSHSHKYDYQSGSSGTGLSLTGSASSSSTVTTNSGGSHTHTITVPAATTGASGSVSTGTSSSASSLPPYKEVVFCKKD
jgi:hypothetical protein